MRRYSRLASTEEKRNIKLAYKYIFLSIVAIVFLILLGIPILVKFAGFIGDIAKSDKPVEINDITPPAPPQFDDMPEFTNKEILEITGRSEEGAAITIRANGENSEVVANNNGEFSFTFNLEKGDNTIDAKAKDISGNESTQAQTYRIFFDNQDPELEIISPSDGTSYYGSNQRQLSIKGKVDETVELTVNNRFVTLKDDGTFNYTTTLSEGENRFDIKAIDPSGNETSTTFVVNFSL